MQSISSQNDKFHASNAFHEFYDVCNNLGASACSHKDFDIVGDEC